MKKALAFLTGGLVYLLNTTTCLASTAVTIEISKPDTVQITNLGTLIGSVIAVVLIVSAIAAFFYLIWGGFSWITSGGDKTKVEAAQHRLQAAILGLFIVFAVWAIFMVIQSFLGVTIIGGAISIPRAF